MSDDLYRKLQQHLDRMPIPFPATRSGIEIRLLQRLFAPAEAEIALALSMVPETASTIYKRVRSRSTVEELERALAAMAERGLIERTPGSRARFGKSALAIGMYERQLPHLTAEFQRDIEQYMREAFGAALHSRTRAPQLRTVPVNVDITPERGIASYDDIRGFVRTTEGPFAVMDCICRKGADLTGHSCKQTSLRSSCLTFGPAAEGMVASGAARFITRDAMLEALDIADREGLVLQPQNTTRPLFICCCCGCCCGILVTAKRLPEPASYFAASYHAAVDADLCSACGTCEPRCQMEAIAVGDAASSVDLARCIGCGLCVTTCTTGAMTLEPNRTRKKPSASTPSLYLRIYRNRFGTFEAARALGKAILRRQI
jgi:NAD-dependent dihydropyrimidine dehydrogenase PreA subunit